MNYLNGWTSRYLDHDIRCLQFFQLSHGLISGCHFDSFIVSFPWNVSFRYCVFLPYIFFSDR